LRPLEGLHDQPSFVLGRRNEVLASNALLDGLLTRFDHPLAGRLDTTYEAPTLPGDPDQVLFVYADRTDTDLVILSVSYDTVCPSRVTPFGGETG